jgi:DNA-binding NtrC family response regulator
MENHVSKGMILVVEDKASMAQMLRETLELEGYEVITAADGAEGISKVSQFKVDAVLTDLKLPKKNGLEVLKASKEENPLVPVIVMTAFGSIETAVKAMKSGAYDFITKPVDTDRLFIILKRSLKNRKLITENLLLKGELSHQFGMPKIIGKSSVMLEVAENIRKVAPTKSTVLLLGESGTGKELFARAIHFLSPRRDEPFVPVNCAAIPKELLESELFGHEKGAFTGASSLKLGKFELASRGTIFLDEIGEMDIVLQSKVLRAIQEGEIERVGGTKTVNTNLRIIAASNRDLEAAVSEGSFREDLYYRLNVFPLRIPELRNRGEDIPALVDHFIHKYSLEMNKPTKDVTPEAMEMLKRYSWKGNVRELENVIERALILCEKDKITLKDFGLNPAVNIDPALGNIPLDGTLDEAAKAALRIVESRRISKALEDTGGNKSRAAELLKVSYKTILTKIKEYRLDS